jgi:hypothetical protein
MAAIPVALESREIGPVTGQVTTSVRALSTLQEILKDSIRIVGHAAIAKVGRLLGRTVANVRLHRAARSLIGPNVSLRAHGRHQAVNNVSGTVSTPRIRKRT